MQQHYLKGNPVTSNIDNSIAKNFCIQNGYIFFDEEFDSQFKSKKKISVIMSHYNNSELISNAIFSFCRQSHENKELIIVDDCSDLNHLEKLKYVFSLAKKSGHNIRLFLSKKNNGTYSCRNFAIKKSSGDLITFLDSDDFIEPDHLRNLSVAIEKSNSNASICLYKRKNIKNPNSAIIQPCEASFMFQKNMFLEEFGYYSTIRFGGDTEYRIRNLTIRDAKKIKSISSSKGDIYSERFRKKYGKKLKIWFWKL